MHMKPEGVSYLKKIAISLEAGSSAEEMDSAEEPYHLSFIYGVGKEGISLFEKSLFGKRPGDEVVVGVTGHQIDDILGHLRQPIQNFFHDKTDFFLKVRVNSIETPDEREIIQAIAGGTGTEGCSCGCGCGGSC